MRLCGTLHGRRAWPELELHGRSWKCSLERGEEGAARAPRGEGGLQEGEPWGGLSLSPAVHELLCSPFCADREVEEGKKREKEKKEKGKKEKEKKIGKFSKI
jgi:hypothetical protein